MKLLIDLPEAVIDRAKGKNGSKLCDIDLKFIGMQVADGIPITNGEFLLALMQSVMTPEQLNEILQKMSERPQGEWIRTGSLGNGNAHYECSNCHYGDEHAESQEVPYCWHCGASMKKGETDA